MPYTWQIHRYIYIYRYILFFFLYRTLSVKLRMPHWSPAAAIWFLCSLCFKLNVFSFDVNRPGQWSHCWGLL